MEQFDFWTLFLGAVIGIIATIIIELAVIYYLVFKS
jgi:hypothetical protein